MKVVAVVVVAVLLVGVLVWVLVNDQRRENEKRRHSRLIAERLREHDPGRGEAPQPEG